MHFSMPVMRAIPSVTRRAGNPSTNMFLMQETNSGFTLSHDIGDTTSEYAYDISMDLDAEL